MSGAHERTRAKVKKFRKPYCHFGSVCAKCSRNKPSVGDMIQTGIRISDERAAASAFWSLSKLSGSSRVPSDQDELSSRLSRVTGRRRPLAVALGAYVQSHGFAKLHGALVEDRGEPARAIPSEPHRFDAEAAATASSINFDGADPAAIIFASSGLY
jgi:hypothetical protein